MRYLLLASLLLLSGCYYPYYGYGYGYPYAGYGSYGGPYPATAPYPGYASGGQAAPPPGAAYAPDGGAPQFQQGFPGPLDPQNCGTPDEPKGCGRQG